MPSKKSLPEPQSLELPFAGADSHAHLDDPALLPDLADVLRRAEESGVSLIVHMFLLHERYAANRQVLIDAAAGCPRPVDLCFARGLHPEDILHADETSVLRRGRNAHTGHVTKNASESDYHMATALEALFGYLYLSGRQDRLRELFDLIVAQTDLVSGELHS